MDFEVSIIDYLGKFNPGVIVLINISYENHNYESTFYYDKENIVLTIPEELEEKIGDIKKHPHYGECLKQILSKIVPWKEIYNRLDNLDVTKWVMGTIELPQDEQKIIDGLTIDPSAGI